MLRPQSYGGRLLRRLIPEQNGISAATDHDNARKALLMIVREMPNCCP